MLAAGQAEQLANQAAARVRDEVNVGAIGQPFEQRHGVLDRAFRQRPVLEAENAVTVVGLQAFAQLLGVSIARIPQLAIAAGRARRGAVDEDQRRSADGRDGAGAGYGRQDELSAAAHLVQPRFVAAELFVLKDDAELAGCLLGDINAEKIEDANSQPGRPTFADRGQAWCQAGEFPGTALAAWRWVAVFASQVVGPAPQDKPVFERNTDDSLRLDFDVLAGAIAGATRGQAEQRLWLASLACAPAAGSDLGAADAYRTCAHVLSPVLLSGNYL